MLTNPEYLHLAFLQHSSQWIENGFLPNLKFLVIDEIHEYRGFFGTNAALLFRRFRHKLAQLGAKPTIILSSATCANPIEHASRLLGIDARLIADAKGMRPPRHFAFIDPDIPDYQFQDIFRVRIARAALACLSRGLSTIVFCPSRKFVERVTKESTRLASEFGLDPETIIPYRAGYNADQRRADEEGLRDGRYKIVFTTNALEIGIDIGRLDACILAGFPENVMSAWQRIGRAGRSWQRDAYVIYFALNNAVDQFYARNLDAFLSRQPDHIVVGIDNDELIKRHLPCLLYESQPQINGLQHTEMLGELFAAKYREVVPTYNPATGHGQFSPHNRVPIRAVGDSQWKLKVGQETIGTVSGQQKFRECFVGAIYLHSGKSFRVASLGANEIFLEDADPNLRTEPKIYSRVNPDSRLAGQRWNELLSTFSGTLTIYENFTGYRVLDRDGSVIDDVQVDPSSRPLRVRAFWIENATDSTDVAEGMRGVEQLIRIGAPFVIPCDRHDLGTLTNPQPPATTFVHETVPGGIGLAEKLYEIWRVVLEKGIEIARLCDCKNGCPRCIHANRYDNNVASLSKSTSVIFATHILEITRRPATETLDAQFGSWATAINDT